MKGRLVVDSRSEMNENLKCGEWARNGSLFQAKFNWSGTRINSVVVALLLYHDNPSKIVESAAETFARLIGHNQP